MYHVCTRKRILRAPSLAIYIIFTSFRTYQRMDRVGPIVQGAAARADPMPGVCSRPGGGVICGTPSDPTWDWQGWAVGEHPATIRPKALQGLFPQGVQVGKVPRQGLQGGSKNRTNLRIHFVHFHLRYTILVLD